MKQSELLDIYYDLYDILGEIETIADAIRYMCHTEKTRGCILQHLEYTRLWNLNSELNQLYDMPMTTLKAFKLRWNSIGRQSDIFDFIQE